MKNQKIYVAASHTQREVIHLLRDAGYNVISTWDIEDTNYDPHDLRRAARDIAQIRQCDIFICQIGDTESGGGRHFELGLAHGLGKTVILVGDYDTCIFQRVFARFSMHDFEDMINAVH